MRELGTASRNREVATNISSPTIPHASPVLPLTALRDHKGGIGKYYVAFVNLIYNQIVLFF